MSRHVIGVDVGGTFTDVFFLDQETGAVSTAKAPSTRGDQSKGFIEGVEKGVVHLVKPAAASASTMKWGQRTWESARRALRELATTQTPCGRKSVCEKLALLLYTFVHL